MKIPRISDDRVQEQQLPNASFRVNPGDFGQQNIQASEKAITGIIEQAQQQADEAVQLQAGTLAAQKELEWNRRIRDTRGEAALGLGSAFEKEWGQFQADTEKSLVRSPKQKAMVQRLMSSNYAQLRNNIDAHTSSEMDRFYTDQADAFIKTDRATAVESMDTMRIAESVGKQKASIQQLALKQGWSKEKTELSLSKVEQDTNKDYLSALAVSSPEQALELLKDNEFVASLGGIEEANTLRSFAEKQQKIQEHQIKLQVVNNDMQMFSDIAAGKILSPTDIAKSFGEGSNSPEAVKAAMTYLSKPDLIDVENTPAFTEYVDRIFDANSKEAVNRVFKDALEGGADKRPNQDELMSLIKIASIRSKGMSLQEYSDQKLAGQQEKKTSPIDAIFRTVKDWVQKYQAGQSEQSRMMKEMIVRIESGEKDLDKIKQEVIQGAQVRTNPNRSKYSVDQIITAPNGQTAKIIGFDDDGEPILDIK